MTDTYGCDRCGAAGTPENPITVKRDRRLVLLVCSTCDRAGLRPTVARRVARFVPADMTGRRVVGA